MVSVDKIKAIKAYFLVLKLYICQRLESASSGCQTKTVNKNSQQPKQQTTAIVSKSANKNIKTRGIVN